MLDCKKSMKNQKKKRIYNKISIRMCELNSGMRMTEASDIYERNIRYI